MYLKKELYELIQSDERIFDFIQECSLDGLWYWDLENPENEWMNARFWTVLGYNPDEMPHKSSAWKGIINQDDLKVANENFVKHCENPNHPYDQIVRYIHKDGSTKWIHCRGLAIRDSAGKPIRMLGAHQDISEIKNSETALLNAKKIAEESEEKYRALYNNAPLSYQSLDENGCFIDINPMWTKTLGYERAEVIGEWFGDFLHPDSVEHFRINFPAFIKRGYVYDVQFKLRRKDNTYIDVSFEGSVSYTPEGNFKQTYCVFKDITEQKALEKALIAAKERAEESEETFRKLFEDSSDAILLVDNSGVFAECNQATLDLLKTTREQFLNKTPASISPEFQLNGRKSDELAHEMIQSAYENGLCRFDWIHIGSDNVEFIVDIVLMPIVIKGQNMLHVTWRNITHRIKTEKELLHAKEKAEESERKFRNALENSPIPTVIAGVDGTTIYLNKQFIQVYGYTIQDIPTIEKWYERAYPDPHYRKSTLNDWNRKVEQSIKNDIPTRVKEYEVTCKNGEVKTVAVSGYFEKEIIVGLFQDITERKQAEEEYLKFFTITEKALYGSVITDPDGNIVYVNDYFAQIHGYTAKELIGSKLDIFHSDAQMPLLRKTIEDALKKRNIEAVEIPHLHKNGQEFPMLMSLAVINDSYGKPKYIAATAFDLTEQKSVQQKLQNTINDQNILLNNDPTLIYFKDCSNNIIRVTESVAKATGLTREQIEGRHTKEIYPDMADQYWEDDLEVIKSGKPKHNIVEPLTGVDGSSRWLLTTKVPVKNDSGEIVGICVFATDITDLKNAELELLKAKEKAERNQIELIKAQEIAHLGSWYLDIDTNEVVWTEEIYKMYGFDPEMPPPPYPEHKKLFTPESWDILSTSLAKTRETGIPYELELKTIRKDNSNGWMWVRGEAVFDENKKIAELWGAAQDITERKHVEEALRKSQNNYQNLVENTPDIIYSMNTEGYFTFVSNNVSRYGFTPEEMIGHHIHEYIHPDDVEEVLSDLQKSFEQDTPVKSVFRLASRESNTIWFEDTSRKLIENDQVTGFTGIIRDITKRKEAEEALLKSNQRLESLLDISRKITSTIDQNVIMQMVVDNAIKLLGLDTGAIYLKTDDETINLSATTPALPDNFPGELRKAYLKNHPHLQKAMKTGKYVLMEDALTTKLTPEEKNIVDQRQLRTVLYYPIKIREMSIGVLILSSTETARVFIDDELNMLQAFANQAAHIIDNVKNYADLKKHTHELEKQIKQREKAEKELIVAKEQAEESDRLKTAFLANMSHEIRTPMNGILGFAELLKEPDRTGDEQQRFIGIIEKSGKRMLNIINDIVDISKIEAGLMELDVKESNINMQIEYIYTFFKPEAETKGIKLSFSNTLSQKEATIKTDREKVYAILTNLVKNAIKYTKEGAIEFGYHLKRYNEALELEFYVKDTGIGIPKDRQEAIFERFIQADIADKMAYQGAGLGLAISKAYVEMLGGKIWVESEEGIGSTFYFTLPYSAKPVKETIDQQHEPFGKSETVRKLKILVAEDDEVSEMLIGSFIKAFGKEILIARTGVEAVEVCRNNPDIDLILMDIRMPHMDGYEATKQIRAFNKDVIIIAQTAYGLTGDREKAIKSGCNDYITKPIKKTELLKLMQHNLK